MYADDFVGIVVDTYNTMQNGYSFLVNPLGVQGDGIMTTDGNLTAEQDFVWDSKGRLDDQGYIVEYRVPLQSIRFPSGKTITIRLAYFRQIVRTSEMASAPPVYPDKSSFLAQTQPIAVTGWRFKRVVEILPAVTHSDRRAVDEGTMKREERATDVSLTAKVGLTTDLTLDAALNPDFSQVESDAGQVDINLRYALFTPRRGRSSSRETRSSRSPETPRTRPSMPFFTRTIIDPTYGSPSAKSGRPIPSPPSSPATTSPSRRYIPISPSSGSSTL